MSQSPRIPWWRRWFGSRSERAAARHLKGLGYRIVARNHSTKLGELDLIALDAGTIVCIIEAMKVMNEVKAGTSGTVAEILADNSQPVEFGTKLLRIT